MRPLELDAEQRALAGTARRFCEDTFRGDGEVVGREFDRAAWRRLADLGLLMLATEEGGGGAVHVAAVMEQLGRAGFPGPLAETVAGESPRVPWAPLADVFIKVESDGQAYRAVPASPVRELAMLAAQPWGEVELDASDRLGPAAPAICLADIARAAYVAGAAARMVETTAEYVRHRRQFGRSLGEFQAVAHPIADCHARVVAARDAALFAAHHADAGGPSAAALSAAARLSATDAVTRTAYACHQAMGGMGFVEGTLLSVLTRIARVVTLAPPGLDATRRAALRRFAADGDA